jgi:hypothetical protein
MLTAVAASPTSVPGTAGLGPAAAARVAAPAGSLGTQVVSVVVFRRQYSLQQKPKKAWIGQQLVPTSVSAAAALLRQLGRSRLVVLVLVLVALTGAVGGLLRCWGTAVGVGWCWAAALLWGRGGLLCEVVCAAGCVYCTGVP